ncbi:MAG: hypothetical protein U0792_15110 [Gemmataceae bacterium]
MNAWSGFTAILRNPDDAEEVVQEILLGLLNRGGVNAGMAWPERGRAALRDLSSVLIARNAAISYLQEDARPPLS